MIEVTVSTQATAYPTMRMVLPTLDASLPSA
jgi:hypothetical protein